MWNGYNRHMQKHRIKHSLVSTILLISFLLISACEPLQQPTAFEPTQGQEQPTVVIHTVTPEATLAPTQIPAALSVNGVLVPLSYFQNEVLRYKDSLTNQAVKATDQEIQEKVIEYLVEQELLAQAASAAGFALTDEQLQARIDQLVAELGSGGALTTWMQVNHYDDAEFRASLRLAAEAAWQRDQVIQSVPNEVEQVRAQQIFASTEAGAQRALNSLNAGAEFEKLAWEYSPESGGELGWFPRGYLLYPEVEEAAFSLEPGSYSEIIQSTIGYHILLVLEHEQSHPLTTDARVSLQAKALQDWLAQARSNVEIEVLLP